MQELSSQLCQQDKSFLLLGYELIDPFIAYAIREGRVKPPEAEQLRDDLADDVLSAVKKFNPAKGKANNYLWTRWLRFLSSRNRRKPWRPKVLQADKFRETEAHVESRIVDYKLVLRLLLTAPLAPRKLKILACAYILGLNIREIAGMLHMSAGSVIDARNAAIGELRKFTAASGMLADDFHVLLDPNGNKIEED